MKNLIIGSLSLLLISTATAPAVRAEKTVFNPAVTGSTGSYIPQITPFNLVNLAYQGNFREQGIPGYSSFRLAYLGNKISALDIVRSAVKANKLPQAALSDKRYINAVANQLDNFRSDFFPLIRSN